MYEHQICSLSHFYKRLLKVPTRLLQVRIMMCKCRHSFISKWMGKELNDFRMLDCCCWRLKRFKRIRWIICGNLLGLKRKMSRLKQIKISEYKHHCQDRTVSVNFSFYRFLLRCHIELCNLFNIFLLAVWTTFLAFRCGPVMASIRETSIHYNTVVSDLLQNPI